MGIQPVLCSVKEKRRSVVSSSTWVCWFCHSSTCSQIGGTIRLFLLLKWPCQKISLFLSYALFKLKSSPDVPSRGGWEPPGTLSVGVGVQSVLSEDTSGVFIKPGGLGISTWGWVGPRRPRPGYSGLLLSWSAQRSRPTWALHFYLSSHCSHSLENTFLKLTHEGLELDCITASLPARQWFPNKRLGLLLPVAQQWQKTSKLDKTRKPHFADLRDYTRKPMWGWVTETKEI